MIRKAVRLIGSQLALIRQLRGKLGFREACEYALVLEGCRQLAKRGVRLQGTPVRLHVKGSRHPLYARYGTSDLAVFRQIFLDREYAALELGKAPQLVIDCGANVGYSSRYFLSAYPQAKVIAIEPDEHNFSICEKNLAPYRGRVALQRAAVWSRRTGLKVVRGQYRDGREWATQVRECTEGESPDVEALSLAEVLSESGCDTIDLLKVDIERAELALFSPPCDEWLGRTKNIVIELHDQECQDVFFTALRGYDYAMSRHGELTLITGLRNTGGRRRTTPSGDASPPSPPGCSGNRPSSSVLASGRRALAVRLVRGSERRSLECDRPVVSVIVCTYNRCGSLRETLKALQGQRAEGGLRLEIVVVDNNSTDRTRDVVHEAGRDARWPIRYVFEGRQGLSHARNRGVQEATGDLVAFTDDDVLPEPGWVQALVEAFLAYQGDCVGGRILPLWLAPPPQWMTSPHLRKVLWGMLALLDHGDKALMASENDVDVVYGANMAFRKGVLDALGHFRPDLGPIGSRQLRGDDTDMVSRLLRAGGRVVYEPRATVHHQVPRERMRMRYLRDRRFHAARSAARMQTPLQRRLEPWRLRECLTQGLLACLAYGRGQRARGIEHELRFWSRLGGLLEGLRLQWTLHRPSA